MSNTKAPSKEAVNDELAAMRRIVNALEGLDRAAQRRVLCWIFDRFDYEVVDVDVPLTLGGAVPYTPSTRD